MAGTTRLELATSAVTVRRTYVFSTTWKSTDGTLSHCKYTLDNVVMYRGVYRASLFALAEFGLFAYLWDIGSIPTAPTNHLPDGWTLKKNTRGQKGAD
jgi:hypothetical protein